MKISNESLLCQKARVRWLKESDCNSKYFHSLINWKRRKNFVKGLFINKADYFRVDQHAKLA